MSQRALSGWAGEVTRFHYSISLFSDSEQSRVDACAVELLELVSLEEQTEANNRLGSLLLEWRYVAFECITFIIPVR